MKIMTVDNYYGCQFGAVCFYVPFKLLNDVYKYNEKDLSELMRNTIIKLIVRLDWPKLTPMNECSITNGVYSCVFLCDTNKIKYEFYKSIANENL